MSTSAYAFVAPAVAVLAARASGSVAAQLHDLSRPPSTRSLETRAASESSRRAFFGERIEFAPASSSSRSARDRPLQLFEVRASTASAAVAAPPPSVTHYDKHEIHTNSGYRFEYLSKFMGFTAEDIATIRGSAPVLGPLVPALVEAVYQKLLSFDVTRKYFAPMDPAPGEAADAPSEKVLAYRKEMLRGYLVRLVTGEYDGKMVEYLDRVGRVHTAKAGDRRVEVDLVHVSALFGFVNDALVATFQTLDGLDQATRDKLVRAFTKLLWVQSDFFVRHFTRFDAEDA